VQGQLDLGGRSSRAPIALVTLAARPTILRMTAAQRHAAGKPGPRGSGTHANRRARAEQPPPKAPPVNRARPAHRARPASTAMTPSTARPTRTARPARTSELRRQTRALERQSKRPAFGEDRGQMLSDVGPAGARGDRAGRRSLRAPAGRNSQLLLQRHRRCRVGHGRAALANATGRPPPPALRRQFWASHCERTARVGSALSVPVRENFDMETAPASEHRPPPDGVRVRAKR
jgi:hypothetical protein